MAVPSNTGLGQTDRRERNDEQFLSIFGHYAGVDKPLAALKTQKARDGLSVAITPAVIHE